MRREVKLLKALGDLRDGILLADALVYVAGYVVWSINSLRNNRLLTAQTRASSR
jgi:hypothetical protein